MSTSYSYLFDAGWLFFAAWSVVVAFVNLVAFGRDLIPFRKQLESSSRAPTTEAVGATESLS